MAIDDRGKLEGKRENFPCAKLTEHCSVKGYGGMCVYINAFVVSTLFGSENPRKETSIILACVGKPSMLLNRQGIKSKHSLKILGRTLGFTALKNGVFWDVTPCCSCKNIHFGGT
jgi:hypothetical protein